MMAKISSILPSNKRITSTDMANERPVRPGTPSWGGPVAQTADPKNEFRKVELEESDVDLSNYGADGKLASRAAGDAKSAEAQKIKNDVEIAERVSEGFQTELDLRA